jgi:outer membrane lipoprotein SlyB
MRFRFLIATLASFLLGAAALVTPATAEAAIGRCGKCGTITRVETIAYEGDKGAQGAVAGVIIGGLLGNQIGSGSGRTAATIAGAIGGGLVGRKVDRNDSANGERGLRLEIRMDNGSMRTVEIAGTPRLYKGDRVRVERNRVDLL